LFAYTQIHQKKLIAEIGDEEERIEKLFIFDAFSVFLFKFSLCIFFLEQNKLINMNETNLRFLNYALNLIVKNIYKCIYFALYDLSNFYFIRFRI